ncbi:zona pellucida sperm-binding protein 3-like isoform X1 [Amia ocellicauda]|uniref:zona pellucida sperm-binding protein 3-like isoform X1 n=1 Tax=Amia ocellicauda TaxID=2972642 RepID=UPI0034648DA2
MYFQATGYFATEGQRLFIQSCYATASPDRHSKPRFTVIDNFGCLVDSKADGCQSRFVPYTRKDVLCFTIDAFLFQKTLSEHGMTELYMHCTMTLVEHVTPGTKSCTYNRKAKRYLYCSRLLLGGKNRPVTLSSCEQVGGAVWEPCCVNVL